MDVAVVVLELGDVIFALLDAGRTLVIVLAPLVNTNKLVEAVVFMDALVDVEAAVVGDDVDMPLNVLLLVLLVVVDVAVIMLELVDVEVDGTVVSHPLQVLSHRPSTVPHKPATEIISHSAKDNTLRWFAQR